MITPKKDAYQKEMVRQEQERAEIYRVLNHVYYERARQDAKWGEQNHKDGTSPHWWRGMKVDADAAKFYCDQATQIGAVTWGAILFEEVCEALEETDEEKLREELIQVAAVCCNWVQAIDRRKK